MKRVREKTHKEKALQIFAPEDKENTTGAQISLCFYFGVLITHAGLQCPLPEAFRKTMSFSRSSTHRSLFNEMYLEVGGVDLS